MARPSNMRRNKPGPTVAPNPPSPPQGPHAGQTRDWLVGLGVPALVFAICLPMTGYVNFWFGVSGAFLALCWGIWDWLQLSKTFPQYQRMFGVGVAALCAIFIGWIAFREAPLTVIVRPMQGDEVGADVGGIKWKPEYSDIRFLLLNKTDENYSDVDIILESDLITERIGFLGSFINCQTAPQAYAYKQKFPHTLTWRPGEPPHTATVSSNQMLSSKNRIHCASILSHTNIEVVLAQIPDDPFSGIPQSARWIIATVEYEAGGHTRTLKVAECFVGDCPEIAGVPEAPGYIPPDVPFLVPIFD